MTRSTGHKALLSAQGTVHGSHLRSQEMEAPFEKFLMVSGTDLVDLLLQHCGSADKNAMVMLRQTCRTLKAAVRPRDDPCLIPDFLNKKERISWLLQQHFEEGRVRREGEVVDHFRVEDMRLWLRPSSGWNGGDLRLFLRSLVTEIE